MATKKKGGGRVVDLTLEVLKDLRAEMRKNNDSLEQLREEHGQKLDTLADITLRLVDRVGTLEKETIRGFTAVRHELDAVNRRLDVTDARIDNLRDLAGARFRGH